MKYVDFLRSPNHHPRKNNPIDCFIEFNFF